MTQDLRLRHIEPRLSVQDILDRADEEQRETLRRYYAREYERDERKRLWRGIVWGLLFTLVIAAAIWGIFHS